jgi:hypothetical protein
MAAVPAIRKSQVDNVEDGLKPVERLEHLEEGLLGEVDRVLPHAHHAGDVRDDPGLVTADDHLEEVLLARQNPAHDLAVLELRGLTLHRLTPSVSFQLIDFPRHFSGACQAAAAA